MPMRVGYQVQAVPRMSVLLVIPKVAALVAGLLGEENKRHIRFEVGEVVQEPAEIRVTRP